MGSLVYRIATSPIDSDYARWTATANASAAVQKSAVWGSRVVLMKNVPATVGRTKLVFRGLKGSSVHVDVYLLDLDREYGYPNRFSRSRTGERITLGGINYRVVSTNRKAITFHRLD
jgi:hypothetical protein